MILDTNALSALATRDRDLIRILPKARNVSVTVITLGEYEFGIRRSRYKKELSTWLEVFLGRAQVLFLDLQTLACYADIRSELKEAGTPIPANDCWIAALARQHHMPVLTRDHHFEHVKDLDRLTW